MRALVLLLFCHYTIGIVTATYNNDSVKSVDCEISPFGKLPTPLLIRGNAFVYPVGLDSTLKLSAGETIDLACPGGKLVTGSTTTTLQVATASCVSGTKFNVNNGQFLFNQLSCSTNPKSIARYTGNSCEQNGKEAEIGFSISSTRFVRIIRICFDQSTQTTLYSYYDLISAINNQVTSTPRPGWSDGTGIYNFKNVNKYYVRGTQRKTINTLLGLSATSTKYIQNNNYYLSRGHLTARSDFFYAAEQNATFYFVNALPQWQTFNGNNWAKAEQDVRDYAEAKNANLRVWTGVYGVTTLPHETTGVQTPLYIYVNGSTKAIAVPEVYWKVVYNPNTQKGVALIGVNNPYKTLSQINVFCTDQSSQLSWLTWQRTDLTRGYSWACTVPQFRRVVNTLPSFTVTGLLV